MAAVVWFVLFWTSFPVKSKSRRFSKTVANDFGSVFIQTLFPSDYTRSLSVSLLNDSVLTTLCLNPPSNLCILCQWKTDVNSRKWILTNHAVLLGGGGGAWFCEMNQDSFTECMTGDLFFEFRAADFLCRFLSESLRLLLKHYAKLASVASPTNFEKHRKSALCLILYRTNV